MFGAVFKNLSDFVEDHLRIAFTPIQIIEDLTKQNDWSDNTIKTLIHRLFKKEVLGREKLREYRYYSEVKREAYLKKESKSFIQKLFKGATAPMISHFVESSDLSKKDLEQIKELVEQISKQKDLK